MDYLVDMGLSVNLQSELTGDTLLHRLARDGGTSLLTHVLHKLKHRTVVNMRGQSLLHVAAEYGQLETVAFLIEAGFDLKGKDRSGETPLHASCRQGHTVC